MSIIYLLDESMGGVVGMESGSEFMHFIDLQVLGIRRMQLAKL